MCCSRVIFIPIFASILLRAAAAAPATHAVVDVNDPALLQHIELSSNRVAATSDHGLRVAIAPGEESYPGIAITPADGKPWNLSTWGEVQAVVVNTGKTPLTLSLRIDNEGPWQQEPWNVESIQLNPGASGDIKVIFGCSYGHKPAYALKPSAIIRMNVFAGKSAEAQSFRIESITAAGEAGEKLPVDPESIRIEPAGGYLFGDGIEADATRRFVSDGAKVGTAVAANQEAIDLPVGRKSASTLEIKPKIGRWNLRLCNEARVLLRNNGAAPLSPSVRLESNGGSTDAIAVASPINPGAESELTIPFAPAAVWQGIHNSVDRSSWDGQKETGTRFTSDAVSAVSVILPPADTAQSIIVKSVRADAPPAVLPAWLGQRPPVEGDWIKTFDEEFDGKKLDSSKWNAVGKNYYDAQSRFVKENVIVGDGVARLRYEKTPGAWASKADGNQTQYATGFLDTFGKWTQRYGYFEARMKLPRSPGLWPAFWMMPDRGPDKPASRQHCRPRNGIRRHGTPHPLGPLPLQHRHALGRLRQGTQSHRLRVHRMFRPTRTATSPRACSGRRDRLCITAMVSRSCAGKTRVFPAYRPT